MKTVSINFSGFWPDFDKENNLLTNLIRESFEVKISDNPDYLFVSMFDTYSYLGSDAVRIFYTAEPYAPDFNLCDYAIGFDPMEFKDDQGGDRYYRFPGSFFYLRSDYKKLINGLSYDEAREALSHKKYFCNFIYGHRSAKGERERIFEALQEYKRVESPGRFMNNMPDGLTVPRTEAKFSFLRDCKFTISCESVIYPGFVSEKIMDPFYSDSIPIYYGSRYAEKEFNPESYINIRSCGSIEESLEQVKLIDQDDDRYIHMLMQPKLISEHYLDNLTAGLRNFLYGIVSQDKAKAFRRQTCGQQKKYEEEMREYMRYRTSKFYRVIRKMARWQDR